MSATNTWLLEDWACKARDASAWLVEADACGSYGEQQPPPIEPPPPEVIAAAWSDGTNWSDGTVWSDFPYDDVTAPPLEVAA